MPKRSNKKGELVLVTGGAGFIGGHLADALILRGYRVRVLDSLCSPTHHGVLPEWFNPGAEFMRGDVRRKQDWRKALEGVSYVFHLAAHMDFHLDFSSYFAVNTLSTALLYEVIVADKIPVKKVIVASSQSVYGEGKYRCRRHGLIYAANRPASQLQKGDWEVRCPYDHIPMQPLPIKETDFLLPTTPYGISKKALEEVIFSLGRMYHLPSVALRYSIVLGPRQSFRHFYSGALRQFSVMMLGGEPLVIHEDGQQIRDYIDVRDVVAAHLKVLESQESDFSVFNVGSAKPTRVSKLAKIVAKLVGAAFNPQMPGMYRLGAPRHSPMDIKRLTRLGWSPRFTLEESVRSYIEWIRKYPEAKKYLLLTLRKMREANLLRS